ncbi:MAG: hypothetical protein ACOYOS_02115 [Syntrophales bacterium]
MSKVFVLGAGASKEYISVTGFTAPLNGDFWGTTSRIIDEAIKKGNPGLRPEDGGRLDLRKIVNSLKLWYPINKLVDLNHYGLEQVFSDVQQQHPDDLNTLQWLLEKVLSEIIRGVDQNSAPTHYAFVKNMLQPGDSIITFNYDIITDRTIEDISKKEGSHIKWHPSSGYGLSFSGFINQLTQGFLNGIPTDNYNKVLPLEYAISDVVIYKLHGSLGWIEREDHTLALYLTSIDNKVQLAQKGHLAGSFFIVPPIQDKDKQFRREWIEKLWEDAEERLSHADQVFCVGYSFPRTDSKAINMFKRGCKGKPVNIILPEIDQNERMMIRLCEIFDNKPHFVSKTFSQWVHCRNGLNKLTKAEIKLI